MITKIEDLKEMVSSLATEDLDTLCELPSSQLDHLFGIDYGRQTILFDKNLCDESLVLSDELQDWLYEHTIDFEPKTFTSVEELDAYLGEIGFENVTYFDGKGQDYITAVIGIDHNKCRVVYDFDEMVTYLVEQNKNEGEVEEDDYDYDSTDAIEWIDYNAVRSLPYYQNSPIIISKEQTEYIKS